MPRHPQFKRRALCTVLCCIGVSWLPSTAVQAQPEGPNQHSEAVAEERPEEDTTAWAASLGGTLNTGNTRSWQLTAGSDLRLVRGPSVLGANLAFAYGRADVPDDMTDDLQDTVKNFRAKLRYDYFLSKLDALFLAGLHRWDVFAGIDARVQGQVGYLRMFIKEEKQRLCVELGYYVTYYYYHVGSMMDLEETVWIHSARGFVGYDNTINETLTYVGGLEALLNVEEAEDVRLAFDNAIRSAINGKLQLEIKFTLIFDNVPVEGKQKTDTTTLVSLIYNLI